MRKPMIVLPLLVLSAGPVRGQVPAGGKFQVNSYVTSYQFASSAEVLADGSFVVVWSDFLQDGSNNGVYAKRYDARGTPLLPEFRVNTFTTGSQGLPEVAALANGGLAVVFMSDQPPAGIWARVYDRGLAALPEFRVQTTTAYSVLPKVAPDPRGGFIVVWEEGDGDGLGVMARRYDRSGAAVGSQFQVNAYTTGSQGEPDVAIADSGAFVVVWSDRPSQDGSGYGVLGQRFDAAGQRLGGELLVNTYTTSDQRQPRVTSDRLGNMVVVWSSKGQDGSAWGIFGQRYDAGGSRRGGEFQANVDTTGYQNSPLVRSDEVGNFVVVWENQTGYFELRARRFNAQGAPRGGEFAPSPSTFEEQFDQTLGSDRHGNFLAAWTAYPGVAAFDVFGRRFGWLIPYSLAVDPAASPTSDGNRVFEPCETAVVETAWRNNNGATQTFSGLASAFTGPPGPSYVLADANATYGAVPDGAIGACRTGGDCYVVGIPCPVTRPALHWDAALVEDVTPTTLGQAAAWPVHVGESFADVPRTSPYYLFVETMLHRSVTAGCNPTDYCAAASTTREQMAVFALAGREGPAYAPLACGSTPLFGDVPVGSPFCRWVEELARRGVVTGCGGGNYCPSGAVTREEMAVFALRTLDPTLDPPACGTPVFNDVPAGSAFCRWIEEAYRRGVVIGCGGGNYCPSQAVPREQMAVFITVSFGMGLYGP